MIYIELKGNDATFIHYQPFDKTNGMNKTQEELEQSGILVESLPEAELQDGKNAILKYSETEGLYYEYVDRLPTPEEDLTAMRNENAELMFRSATLEMEMSSIRDENAELMFRLANLEMGGMM